jgi:hypothetical protein
MNDSESEFSVLEIVSTPSCTGAEPPEYDLRLLNDTGYAAFLAAVPGARIYAQRLHIAQTTDDADLLPGRRRLMRQLGCSERDARTAARVIRVLWTRRDKGQTG